jgi:hypothetical protein
MYSVHDEAARSQKNTCYNHGTLVDCSDEKKQPKNGKDDNDLDGNNSNKNSDNDEDRSSCNQNISERELTIEQELRTTTISSNMEDCQVALPLPGSSAVLSSPVRNRRCLLEQPCSKECSFREAISGYW